MSKLVEIHLGEIRTNGEPTVYGIRIHNPNVPYGLGDSVKPFPLEANTVIDGILKENSNLKAIAIIFAVGFMTLACGSTVYLLTSFK